MIGKKRVKRATGIKKGVVAKKVGFEHYDNCLRKGSIYYTRYSDINSRSHELTTDLIKKEALSAFDDKRYLLPNYPLHRTLAWFHKDVPESVKEHCNASGKLKIVNTPVKWWHKNGELQA